MSAPRALRQVSARLGTGLNSGTGGEGIVGDFGPPLAKPIHRRGLPRGSVVKNPLARAGNVGLIPGLGRSPGEGNGNQL